MPLSKLQPSKTQTLRLLPRHCRGAVGHGSWPIGGHPRRDFYNKLSGDCDRIVAGYESFADEFATILSRELDS